MSGAWYAMQPVGGFALIKEFGTDRLIFAVSVPGPECGDPPMTDEEKSANLALAASAPALAAQLEDLTADAVSSASDLGLYMGEDAESAIQCLRDEVAAFHSQQWALVAVVGGNANETVETVKTKLADQVATIAQLERELAERESYIANYQHATKIDQDAAVKDKADAEALRALAAWVSGDQQHRSVLEILCRLLAARGA